MQSRVTKNMIKRVTSTDENVAALIEKLDKYQVGLYGIESCNLESPEDLLKNDAYMLGVFLDEKLVGIGSIKLCVEYAEIKRMYFEETSRNTGTANELLSSLEGYAIGKGVNQVYLETGFLQEAAIKFYNKHGYNKIKSFGQYEPNNVSVYMGKLVGRKEVHA
jgi:putative acetyltransferase